MNTRKLTNTPRGVCRRIALTSAGLLLGLTMNVSAATRTWTGASGTDLNWSTPANWAEGIAPANNDDLVFGGTSGLTNNNDIPVGLFLNSITFSPGAGSYLLQGNKIVMGNNTKTTGITNNSTSVQTIDLETQHNRQVNYETAGTNMIFSKLVWDQRYSKTGPYDLVLLQTLNNTLNGQVTSLTGGRLIMAGRVGGCVGQGLQIDSGGTAVSVGPTNQIGDSDTRADVTMSSNAVFQVQNTNYLGLPDFEQIPMLRSSNSTAVVENGSALGPVQLRVGGGTGARVGAYDGIIRDGAGGGALSIVLNNSSGASYWRLNGTNNYSGDTIITNGSGSGFTRLLVNGVNSGGGNYLLQGTGTGLAVLGGSGFINANTVNVSTNGAIAPGGVLNGPALYARQGGGASGSGGVNTGTFAESTATLTITNNVSLSDPTATLDIHLAGTAAGSFDQLVVAGSGVFSNNSANLNLTIDLGYTPAAGDMFTIVQVQGTSAANNVGVFTKLNGVAADLSQGAIISVNGNQFKISYRGEGTTFDAGAGNGNDIVLMALADTSANLIWRGDVSSDWDVQLTANWRNTNNLSVGATFTNLDKVTFDDTSVNTNVNLTTGLTPAKLLVNATKDYYFTGSGNLTGGIVITKTNTGTVTILTANDNTGAAIISQGTLQLGDNTIDGALNCSITVNSNGVLAFNLGDNQTFSPASFTGTGKFVHNGGGILTITNDYSGTFTGFTTNSGGPLHIGAGSYGSARLGGIIYVGASSPLEYSFPGNQTIASGLSGPGSVNFLNTSGNATFQLSGVNTNFTGQITVNQALRLQINSAAATPSGPIVVTDDGSGFYGAYFASAAGVTNLNSISIQGPGTSGVDTPRGKGALRLASTWAGPITLTANATVGASAGTGTILGTISDGGAGYTLEILGGTLQIGPTTGVNNYGITAIDEDYNGSFGLPIVTDVRILNSHPFGNGVVQMLGRAQLELNGNNVSVPALVDTSITGNGGGSFSPVVLNNSSNAPGTLTVGSDNSSQLFGGVFGNGSTQPLNLTKVGSGTYTLTGDSTNSGTVTVSAGTLALAQSIAFYTNGSPVIGSGSFSNASFAVADSATLDVSGRTDGTLRLNANQTLKHAGAATGTIHVTGIVNIGNGTLSLGINRAGFAHDVLTASGAITYSGTLAVTNIGAVLQVGDSFQLFPGAIAGFTTHNLQTIDTANNVKYTWTDTVSTDGKITVETVGPIVNPTPTNIIATVNGTTLTLSWPPDHTGWTLQSQTNAPGGGLGAAATNWWDIIGSASTNKIDVPIIPTNGSVFFRMKL